MTGGQTYYFAGGGTGGHLFPGLALAAALRSREPEAKMIFAGSKRPLERDLVGREGFEHRELPAEPLPVLRRRPWRFLRRNWRAYRTALGWFREQRPRAVIGLGGFASAPVMLAASRLALPALLLEQNVIPGRATVWLASGPFVVCMAFPGTALFLSPKVACVYTGNPVRPGIARLFGEQVRPARRPTLLVLGGSQGAAALNEAVLRMIEENRSAFATWRICHQTGLHGVEELRCRYAEMGVEAVVEPFFTDMVPLYREATVVISRAGGTTLAELACVGVPAVLVPYPGAAKNHQLRNAQAFEMAGAAAVVEQQGDALQTASRLMKSVLPLLEGAGKRREMARAMRALAQPDATERVLEELQLVIARSQTP